MRTPYSAVGSSYASGVEPDREPSDFGGEGLDAAGLANHPLVIEFAGTPRAGKTTALGGLRTRLVERGREVAVVHERAHRCSVPDKRSLYFNLCTATGTISEVLEACHTGADAVLVDRGTFDALVWMEWHRRLETLSEDEHDLIDGFFRCRALKLPDLVVVMTVDPAEALSREWAGGSPRTPGPIMNLDTLRTINRSITTVMTRNGGDFALQYLDTTWTDPAQTLDIVCQAVDTRLGVRLCGPWPPRSAGRRPGGPNRAGGPILGDAPETVLTRSILA